jgi:hypothetical protein
LLVGVGELDSLLECVVCLVRVSGPGEHQAASPLVLVGRLGQFAEAGELVEEVAGAGHVDFEVGEAEGGLQQRLDHRLIGSRYDLDGAV